VGDNGAVSNRPPRETERSIRRASGGPFTIRNATSFRRYNDTVNGDRAKALRKSKPKRSKAHARSNGRRGNSSLPTDWRWIFWLGVIGLIGSALSKIIL
jgi:hypothetical protein